VITFQEARQIAELEIIRELTLDNQDSLIIIDKQTIEKEYAWIFFYTSKKFFETKDIMFALGGNGPLFISKLNGQISRYRTGLSVDEMIDQYEEENKIWHLTLTDFIFANTNKTLAFRKVLGLTLSQIAECKKNSSIAFENGSRTRLLEIQKQLLLKDIPTSLTQRVLIN
jgi:hypothetical protein